MKQSFDIIIKAPLDICIKKFSLMENSKHWYRGMQSMEHIYGTPNALGSKMMLNFKGNTSNLAVLKAITHKNLPHELHFTYSYNGMINIDENYFHATLNNYTKWTNTSEFIPLNLKMRLKLWLMPKSFNKQSLQYLTDFKNFAENGTSLCGN